ncbi:hypothetical protein F2P81_019408 [Scophthalmus maximus]|uniref:Uncharacterized protein n=1 Tax=Scophthalmus maximus TaxID=52904 RepID=A0A6A4SB57_SCOMX|nr:hypothetical protein F2P81_019408 [Scophthalmus maximus]
MESSDLHRLALQSPGEQAALTYTLIIISLRNATRNQMGRNCNLERNAEDVQISVGLSRKRAPVSTTSEENKTYICQHPECTHTKREKLVCLYAEHLTTHTDVNQSLTDWVTVSAFKLDESKISHLPGYILHLELYISDWNEVCTEEPQLLAGFPSPGLSRGREDLAPGSCWVSSGTKDNLTDLLDVQVTFGHRKGWSHDKSDITISSRPQRSSHSGDHREENTEPGKGGEMASQITRCGTRTELFSEVMNEEQRTEHNLKPGFAIDGHAGPPPRGAVQRRGVAAQWDPDGT